MQPCGRERGSASGGVARSLQTHEGYARRSRLASHAAELVDRPLDDLGQYDAVLIVTDHTSYDYHRIVAESRIVVDTRNATKGITGSNIVHS